MLRRPPRGGSMSRSIRGWSIALLSLAACSKSSDGPLHVASPAWEEQVVYFVMTDRFANGDKTNDDQKKGEFDPTDINKYSGGDLQGIIDKLDYIQGLGATAVWITPPVANMWWDPLQQSGGYHGYWARHLKKVDEHFGTLSTYKALSIALHKRGMYLIQDVVPNHMGNFFTYSSYDPNDVSKGFVKNVNAVPTSKPEQSPFDQNDATDPAQRAAAIYHWTPTITDYNDPNQELNYQISDLDDLNSENQVVRKALRDSYGYWIKEAGVDAFRVDTVKFVPHDFWNDFFYSTDPAAPGMMAVAKATGRDNFFAFGEVYEIPPPMDDVLEHKVASFLGTSAKPELPAVLGFPLYGEIGRVFAGGKPTSYMTYRLGKFMDPTLYPNPNLTPTFIDNHDVQRFLSLGTNAGLLQALAFIFTVPGIPIVYYGTEQGYTETRAAMFGGGYKSIVDHFNTGAALYQKIKTLSAMRKASKAFTHGTLEVLYDNNGGAGAFVYRRAYQGDSVMVMMNTAEENALVSGMDTRLPGGTVLEMLHNEKQPPTPVVAADGTTQLILPARSVLVAHATSQINVPGPPAATITVNTPIEGQTFSNDVTVTGTITPAADKLWMVLDGYITQATVIYDGTGNGSWSTTLPISNFPPGMASHSVAFYTPDAQLATRQFHFTSNVICTPQTIDQDDPVGDDKGPAGTYTYPQDPTFRHQMDMTHLRLEMCKATMNLKITMADWSTVWNPPLKFDHVAFNIFFAVPAKQSANVMPFLNTSTPPGFAWSHDQFSYGWQNAMYDSNGASASSYGAPVTAPTVSADPATKTVTFTYLLKTFGVPSWSGIKVYVTTWDFDGIKGVFRPLSPAGGQWEMGGGQPTDPKWMDDHPPIPIP
jgi:glycosidase